MKFIDMKMHGYSVLNFFGYKFFLDFFLSYIQSVTEKEE